MQSIDVGICHDDALSVSQRRHVFDICWIQTQTTKSFFDLTIFRKVFPLPFAVGFQSRIEDLASEREYHIKIPPDDV
jgi:hypothetical protein